MTEIRAGLQGVGPSEEPEDSEEDVGPPAPGEGGDLENPEIGMEC
jgi:hypothetical protein